MSDQLNIFEKRVHRFAVISKCGNYRYYLLREWDVDKPKVMFLMLNPSTADAMQDDPTVRRCINFAKDWGYGGLLIGNLFDFRSTDPDNLLETEKPFSFWNHGYIQALALMSDKVICGWGHHKIVTTLLKRFPDYNPLESIADKCYYLEMSNDITPKHPLFLKGNLKPKKMFV